MKNDHQPSHHGRILGVDPGNQRTGIAISDPTQTIASPIGVIHQQSRKKIAEEIVRMAKKHSVEKIIIGQAVNWDGSISHQGKKAARMANVLESLSSIPILLWNEYGSTQQAEDALRQMNIPRKKRNQPVDDLAAVVILQSYLDAAAGERLE